MAGQQLGSAALYLRADSTQLDKGLAQAQQKVQGFGKNIDGILGKLKFSSFLGGFLGSFAAQLAGPFYAALFKPITEGLAAAADFITEKLGDIFIGGTRESRLFNAELQKTAQALEQVFSPNRTTQLQDATKDLTGSLSSLRKQVEDFGLSKAEAIEKDFTRIFGTSIPDNIRRSIDEVKRLDAQLERLKNNKAFEDKLAALRRERQDFHLSDEQRIVKDFERKGIDPVRLRALETELSALRRLKLMEDQFAPGPRETPEQFRFASGAAEGTREAVEAIIRARFPGSIGEGEQKRQLSQLIELDKQQLEQEKRQADSISDFLRRAEDVQLGLI